MQAITKTWYEYLEEGKIMGLKCKRCGKVHSPPYPICHECSGMEMEWVPVSGNASVFSIALVTFPDQWFTEYAPYYFAYAITDEDLPFHSMIFGIEGEPEEVFDMLPVKAKMEIQKRDGYSYPVYKYISG